MSEPASRPRSDDGRLLRGNAAPGILVARLPSEKGYEPIIVTTLRRYLRRGASDSLLHRIAGGRGHFNILNRVWDLDGLALDRAVWASQETRNLPLALQPAERRIALYQIIADYSAAGRIMPTTWRLARYFHTTPGAIETDLEVMRAQGLVKVTVRGTPQGPRLFVRLAEGTPQ